jgi:predicted metal-dependent phosphoesterase TrpH
MKSARGLGIGIAYFVGDKKTMTGRDRTAVFSLWLGVAAAVIQVTALFCYDSPPGQALLALVADPDHRCSISICIAIQCVRRHVVSADVVARAATNAACIVLALTDHDDVAGLDAAQAAANVAGVTLIRASNLGSWGVETVHIVGLRIESRTDLAAGRQHVASAHRARHRMAGDLAKSGVAAPSRALLTRRQQADGGTHAFCALAGGAGTRARHAPVRVAFTRGNPGYVEHEWTTLENAVGWIRASGGMAVIAHPGRYAFNARELHLLLDAFRALGGEGIEVITGSHHPSEYGKFADLARAFGLKASRGADFHAPGEGIDIVRLPALPHYCQPVWQGWPELAAHLSPSLAWTLWRNSSTSIPTTRSPA